LSNALSFYPSPLFFPLLKTVTSAPRILSARARVVKKNLPLRESRVQVSGK